MSITYDKIKDVNKDLSKTPIKGKDYIEVNQRVKAFRQLIPNGRIDTNIIRLENGICTIKAEVYDENGNMLASGIAEEKESSSFINKTSYVENCETSAVGRALGFLGIGIDTSICTAEELKNAINNQQRPSEEQRNYQSEKQNVKQDVKPKKLGDEQRNYQSEINTYSALLAENSKQSPDDWKQAAKAAYETDKGQADVLIKWWNKTNKDKQ